MRASTAHHYAEHEASHASTGTSSSSVLEHHCTPGMVPPADSVTHPAIPALQSQSTTLYMPIASPPTPAPSPGPIPTHNYPYQANSPLTSVQTHAHTLVHRNHHPSSPYISMPILPPQNPHLRKQLITSLLASCTPEELLFISATIAPRLKRDFLFSLPAELAFHILDYVDDAKTLARMSRVSRYWRGLVEDESVWKGMCRTHQFDDLNEEMTGRVRGSRQRRRTRSGKERKKGVDRTLPEPHFATSTSGTSPILLRTGVKVDESPLLSPLVSPLEEMEQFAKFPMDPAREWLTTKKHQALNLQPPPSASLPSTPSPMHSQFSLPQSPHQRRKRTSLYEDAPFSYRLHFKNSYITMTNWRKGGRLLRTHRMHTATPDHGVVTSLALDAEWVIVGLANSRIQVYSARTGVLARTLVGHELGVWGVCLVSRGGWWEGPKSKEEAVKVDDRSDEGKWNAKGKGKDIQQQEDRASKVGRRRREWEEGRSTSEPLSTRADATAGHTSARGAAHNSLAEAPPRMINSVSKPNAVGDDQLATLLGSVKSTILQREPRRQRGTDNVYATLAQLGLNDGDERKGGDGGFNVRIQEEPISEEEGESSESLEHLVSPTLRVALGLDVADDTSSSSSSESCTSQSPFSSERQEKGTDVHFDPNHSAYPRGIINEDALDEESHARRQTKDSRKRSSRRRPGGGDAYTHHNGQEPPQPGLSGSPGVGKYGDICYSSRGWGQPNSIVVSGGCDKVIMVWDVKTGHNIYRLSGHTSTIRCMRVLHNRPIAVSGSRDATLRVWDVQRGKCLRVLAGHTHSVRCLDVCGNRVVSGSYDTTCRVWNVDTGECLHVLAGHFHQVYSVAFDGKYIASGGLDTTVRLWDANTGECLALLQGHTALVCQLQLSSTILATGGADGRVITFSLQTLAIQHRIAAHDSSVTALQFDREFLVTGGNDGRVRLFDMKTGGYVRELSEPSEGVWKVGFGWGGCAVTCKRGGKTVVEIWSMRPRS